MLPDMSTPMEVRASQLRDAVAGAPTDDAAMSLITTERSRVVIIEVANLCWIGYPEGHTTEWLRKAIVEEARA